MISLSIRIRVRVPFSSYFSINGCDIVNIVSCWVSLEKKWKLGTLGVGPGKFELGKLKVENLGLGRL